MSERVPMSRSEMMSRIGPRNTTPEMKLRRGLHRAGFRFRLHRKDLPETLGRLIGYMAPEKAA